MTPTISSLWPESLTADEGTAKHSPRHLLKGRPIRTSTLEANSVYGWFILAQRDSRVPVLQERQKWNTTSRSFNLGDIVLIVDSSAPHNSWIIGRVVKIMPDSKETVCSVCVWSKTSTLEWPITKIRLLEEVSQDWNNLNKIRCICLLDKTNCFVLCV